MKLLFFPFLRSPILFACIVLIFVVKNACAQGRSAQDLRAAANIAQDLSFPDKSSEFSVFTSPTMALYKPQGEGPFPAIVLQHQCGGLRNVSGKFQNYSMLEWAKVAVKRGYVALILDSLGPRQVDTVCFGAKGGVNFMRGARDALQAAAHLSKFGYVDKQRIAHVGYSWGGMVSLALSGKTWGEALSDGVRFAASVSFYPGCMMISPTSGRSYELLNTDVDKPLLVLMGELDNETPPSDCVPKLENIKSSGGPVRWHVYPQTTHCWDCKNLHNFTKTDVRNNHVTYIYSSAVTENSEQRMFEFLEEALDHKP